MSVSAKTVVVSKCVPTDPYAALVNTSSDSGDSKNNKECL